MYRWYNQLPKSVRLLFVLLLYGCVLVAHVAVVNYYVTHLSEKVDAKEVIVASRDIPLHSIITAEDITLKRVRHEHLISGVITDVSEVIGREAQTPIGLNEQLNVTKINSAVKQKGEMIVEIPSEWVLSFPKSLRRMDKLVFLPVLVTELQPTSQPRQVGSNISTESKASVHASEDDKTDSALEDLTVTEQVDSIRLLEQATELLRHITVAYFKDNSANEITDSVDSNNETSPRLRSSNLGARLEVAMNEQQWELLRELRLKQYKFVISYE